MKYKLDSPVPINEIEEISGAEIIEEVNNDITPKTEILPEFAHRIEATIRETAIHTLGVIFDSMLLFDLERELIIQVTNKAIELLKIRNVCDLRSFDVHK